MGGRRYNNEPKLNIKKVVGVVVAIAVIIMFVITLVKLLKDSEKTPITTEKTSYFSVFTNNKWGVIDDKQNVVIEPTYEEMILIPNKQNPVFICTYNVDYTNNTFKTKAINEKGEEILKGYDSIEAISNSYENGQTWYENDVYKVSKNGKFGLINSKGKEILNCSYDQIEAIKGVKECILISRDEKVGLCNIYGNIILNTEYKEILRLSENNQKEFIVKNNDEKYGIVSSDKTTILEPIYEQISNISNKGLYVVKEDGKWAIINKDKSVNITENVGNVIAINDTNIIIENNGKYGTIDLNGDIKIEAKYDDLKYVFGDFYIAKQGNNYGIIDLYHEIKLPFDYTNIEYYQEADIFVADKDDLETDIINNNFQVKLTGVISKIDIEKGYIRIRENGEYKYYNFKFVEKKNTEILTRNTLFLSKQNEKYGYVNSKGDVVVDYIYDDATEQNEYGYVSVNKDGKWGSLDKNGKTIVDPKYNLENNEIIDFIGKWHIGIDAKANYYTDI